MSAQSAPLHASLWQRAPARAAFHIVAVIAGGLALDRAFGRWGQAAAFAWTAAVWGWLFAHGAKEERRVLVLCTVVSALGEVLLSLGWGLYDYRLHDVPVFVPPGHALLMTLGLVVSQRLARRPSARAFQAAFPWAALIYAAAVWRNHTDELGAALFALFAFCMLLNAARALYVTMFVLALLLELYGTALGNWAWAHRAPHFGMISSNPPFAAGAFYCVLDLLVLGALELWSRVGATTARARTSEAMTRVALAEPGNAPPRS